MPILTIDVPDDTWEGVQGQPEKLSQEIRLAAAIFWAKQGRMSKEKAADFAAVGEAQLTEALRIGQALPHVAIDHVVESPSEPSGLESRNDFDCKAESHYQALGRWKGPALSPLRYRQPRTRLLASTARPNGILAGAAGRAMKLMGTHCTRLRISWRISGRPPWHRSLDELARDPFADQALALLKALGWSSRNLEPAQFDRGRPGASPGRFLANQDPDTARGCRSGHAMAFEGASGLRLRTATNGRKGCRRPETLEEELSRQTIGGMLRRCWS